MLLPFLSIFSSDWYSWAHQLSGASETKAQMADPHGAVEATVLVTLEITQHSWRPLGAPAGSTAIPGSFRPVMMFLVWATPAEVTGLSLVTWRWMVLCYSRIGCWFRFAPAGVAVSCLHQQNFLAWAWSCRDL